MLLLACSEYAVETKDPAPAGETETPLAVCNGYDDDGGGSIEV
jgi:hypothetical protein